MNKQEFLDKLRAGLAGLPQDDIEERIAFYSEMIDDRMDEGVNETDAVAQIGTVEEVISQILDDIPLSRIVKDRIAPKKKLPVWAIILIVIGSPIWLAILIVLLAIFLSVYVVIWAIIAVLWAVDLAFVFCAVVGLAAGIYYLFIGRGSLGILLLASGMALTGMTILLFFVSKLATKGAAILTGKIAKGTKALFLRKEEA